MRLKKALALVLALCLSASMAVPGYAWDWGWLSNWGKKDQTKGEQTTTQSSQKDSDSDSSDSADLTLVEDETTVEDGTELRASTYALDNAKAASSTTLKYYSATLYDYDQDTFNNALHQKEVDAALNNGGISTLTQWNGIYFGNGKESGSYSYSTSGEVSYTEETVSYNDRNNSKYTSGSYYVDVNGTKHVVTKLSCSRNGSMFGGYTYKWTITYDGGSATSSNSSITLYTLDAGSQETITLPYAYHNWWTGDLTGNNGNRIYSGIAKDELDANNNILFNYPDGGLFNSDATVKSIYTNVGVPFEYDASTGYYDFDANRFGAYFHTDANQGTSSTPASNSNLYYNTTPQSHNFNGQDQRTRGWFPYDDTTNVKTETANYYFGMNMSIPFTMTANGRMNPNNDDSDPIKFTFSGDDDVWVYIDGKLVLDIGGDRNGMNATLDFSTNSWEITAMTSLEGKTVGDVNGGALSGKIFNDDSGNGKIGQTIETFSAKDSHTLTIFYLERGGGSSNCQIKFNLPMKDSVSVKKIADESMTEKGNVSPLTSEEQEMVNNTDFGFTLYKDDAKVANTNFNLLDVNGNYLDTRTTDENGHFTLKAGQTAKFVGTINSTDGNTYYVVEDNNTNYRTPAYAYTARAANGDTQQADANDHTSMKVKAIGSDEAEDNIVFTCTNYLNADLPNPTSSPADDTIVIDYGLPVVIDVLKNDVHKGSFYELTKVEGAKHGTATIENGKIKYQLTEQLSEVEVLTYTATASNDDGETESAEGTAKVYIIPATTMYYEENFSDLVTFAGGDVWSDKGTAQTDPQEPGVVGTVGDSPYGSDAAYLNDGGDSNGTSKYVNSKDAKRGFRYTFTGTATSFFARTSNNAAAMSVTVTDSNGKAVYRLNRDNIYKAEGTLYNVPVFTYEAENYGTYTVTVYILQPNADHPGTDFYLDGIRVVNPLDETGEYVSTAKEAYATDGEANMTVATLRQKLLKESAIEREVTETDEEGNVTTKTELQWDGQNFVVFTDSNGEVTSAEEYKSNGPKEEVYLNSNQSVTFSLKNWDANSNKLYLGIKAPLGSGSASINGHTLNLSNAADCYYEISSYADITTEGNNKIATFEIKATSSLISVTNIKVTGNAKFTIVQQEDIETQSLDDELDMDDETEGDESGDESLVDFDENSQGDDTDEDNTDNGGSSQEQPDEKPETSDGDNSNADSSEVTDPESAPEEEETPAPAVQNDAEEAKE